MPKKRAVAMVLVLFVLFSVIVVANILIVFFLNQFRLSHHQVNRIQAYYTAMAGINYALEQLRIGNWSSGTYTLRDQEFPWIVRNSSRGVEIRITPYNNTTYRIRVRATYIDQPY